MAQLGAAEALNNQTDLSQKAYMGIRQMLFHDEIGPDQKIAIRDLAKMFGMSTTPVIQALKLLEVQGFVRRNPNKGYYTEPISLKQVQEIYDLRELVEVSLLPETINLLDEPGIKRLYNAQREHFEAAKADSLNEKLLKDMDLHLTLASLANCQTQSRVLKSLFEQLYLKYRGSYFFQEKPIVTDAHRDIVESVVSRDLESAQKLLSEHIRRVKNMALTELSRRLKDRDALVL